jgi:hypothetical protein
VAGGERVGRRSSLFIQRVDEGVECSGLHAPRAPNRGALKLPLLDESVDLSATELEALRNLGDGEELFSDRSASDVVGRVTIDLFTSQAHAHRTWGEYMLSSRPGGHNLARLTLPLYALPRRHHLTEVNVELVFRGSLCLLCRVEVSQWEER